MQYQVPFRNELRPERIPTHQHSLCHLIILRPNMRRRSLFPTHFPIRFNLILTNLLILYELPLISQAKKLFRATSELLGDGTAETVTALGA